MTDATTPTTSPAAAGGAGERDLKPSEALRKARELITPEGAWNQGCYAKTHPDSNSAVAYSGEFAKCWCSLGATYRVAGRNYYLRAECEEFLNDAGNGDIVDFNDAPDRTHAEVLDAFRRAEALAIADGR